MQSIVDKSFFLISNHFMNQILLYSSFFLASFSFILCLYACVRVGNFINATKGLEWDAIANITGDLATTKKTIQTLNNRINGMHSPKIAEQELMLQYLQNQSKGQANGKTSQMGG
jgi:hypothetical protein